MKRIFLNILICVLVLLFTSSCIINYESNNHDLSVSDSFENNDTSKNDNESILNQVSSHSISILDESVDKISYESWIDECTKVEGIMIQVDLDIGEIYHIREEREINVITYNDIVHYNNDHKDLIALKEGNTTVKVSLNDNPNAYVLLNITVKGIPLHHYPLHSYSKEIYMTVGETIVLDNIDIGSMNYYVHNILNPCIEVNTFYEKTEYNTDKKMMKIIGLEEGNSLINFYLRTWHTGENDYQIDTIKVFVNKKDEEYSNQQFYKSYSFYPSGSNKDYYNLGDYEFIRSKSRLFEVLNYCTYLNAKDYKIPYDLLVLDYSKYSILMINRNHSSLYATSKYYGLRIEKDQIYINEKIYGYKSLFDEDPMLDMLVIDNDIINKNNDVNNYQFNVNIIDKIYFSSDE